MRHGTSRASGRGRTLALFALAAALLPLGGLGCAASNKSDLKVTSLNGRQAYDQRFTKAFAGRDAHGDFNVVLASDAAVGQTGGAVAKAADAPAAAHLKQIMHIRVLWAPSQSIKVDGPATTNACIRWYVFTDGRRPDLIEYSGTGMVSLAPDGGVTKVTVQNASLNPTFTRGGLTDPIGPSRFNGTFTARTSPGRVNELLSEIKTTLAATALDGSETAGSAAARLVP